MELRRAAPDTPAILLIGRSSEQWNGLSLPFDLATWGAGPGCTLWSSGELSTTTATDGAGRAQLEVVIPADLDLVGETVFHTWLNVDPGAPGSLGFTTSNGIAAVIGLPNPRI